MFAALDTDFAPRYAVRRDDKRRARLNMITHMLGRIHYEEPPRAKVKLPKPRGYREPDHAFKHVDERY
jgi:hypothetical protein